MSLSFQREVTEVPLSFSARLFFTVFSWRLWERFQTTTVISLCSASDSFITQLRFRWVKSPPMTSDFSSSSMQKWHCLFTYCCSHPLFPSDLYNLFENLRQRLMYLVQILIKCMQIWCGWEWEEHIINYWRGEEDCCLTSTQTHESQTHSFNKTLNYFCTVSVVIIINEPNGKKELLCDVKSIFAVLSSLNSNLVPIAVTIHEKYKYLYKQCKWSCNK